MHKFLPVLPLAILSLAALAQSAPPGGPGGGQRAPVTALHNPLLDSVSPAMDRLESQISLSPAQAALWRDYQEKVGQLLVDQGRSMATPEDWNALQKIEQKVGTVRNRLAAMEDVADAARRFYLSLDKEQQGKADRLLPPTLPGLYSGIGVQPGGHESDGNRKSSEGSGHRRRSPPGF